MLIVGAGLAGLSCAGTLRENGVEVRVLEKSRGVGGRCATRRIEGQPVDHGLAFYHGDDPDFLAALCSVETETPLDWPRRVAGDGAPCQARSFRPEEQRLAFPGGVAVFPKQLARGLDVSLETRVTRIDRRGAELEIETDAGRSFRTAVLVLALPVGQTVELLRELTTSGAGEPASAVELLAGVSTVRCLTSIAGFPQEAPTPEWDVCYPRESSILQMVSHDSTKRLRPRRRVLVLQSRPAWAAKRWQDRTEDWVAELLAAAAPICGDWVARPDWMDTQRWRYARLTGGDALTAPLLLRLDNGSRIGIAGEAMAGGGGAQAAWLSGRRLARRLLGEETR